MFALGFPGGIELLIILGVFLAICFPIALVLFIVFMVLKKK